MPRTRAVRDRVDIWPGFVDALSAILMVVVFLVAVFVLAQFFLGQLLRGRDAAVLRLEERVARLLEELEGERELARTLRRDIARLTADLEALGVAKEEVEAQLFESEAARAELERRAARLAEEQAGLEQRLLALQNERGALARRARALESELAAQERRFQERVASLETQLQQRERQVSELAELIARLEAAQREARAAREEALARAARLEEQIATLSEQLVALGGALELREAEIQRQTAEIAELGRRLNLALASRVRELERYRSDFFGRLRELLGNRPEVRIVGDRFVFQSEILFATGSAEINEEGRRELLRFVNVFKQIMPELPEDLPWVLQVDGHTDKRPIHTPRFPSNWELSTARAIAVARFFIEQGIPPERVAARGFAEYQPLDPRDTEEAYRRNRRIEIRLTTR